MCEQFPHGLSNKMSFKIGSAPSLFLASWPLINCAYILHIFQVSIENGTTSHVKTVDIVELWTTLHDSTMEHFHSHLKLIIAVLKHIIQNESKQFKLCEIERNKLIESLDNIAGNFETFDEHWKKNLQPRFRKLDSKRWEANYRDLVVEEYGQIDWSEYGVVGLLQKV